MHVHSLHGAGARSRTGRLVALALALLLAGASAGCRPPGAGTTVVSRRPIAEVLAAHTPELMAVPGVVGTAEGRRRGEPAILVLVAKRTREVAERVPRVLEGWPVVVEVTGEFRALPDSGS